MAVSCASSDSPVRTGAISFWLATSIPPASPPETRSRGPPGPAGRPHPPARSPGDRPRLVETPLEPYRVLRQGLVFVAFVAVLSNLLLAGLQRTRENGLLGAVGATPASLRRLVLAE